MHASLVLSYYYPRYIIQMRIARRRHTAMWLPNNITKVCSILKLYEHVPSLILSNKVSSFIGAERTKVTAKQAN